MLKHEHKIVLAVLSGAEQEAQNIQTTGEVDIEAEEIGEGVHEQYHQFAHELMKH
jgi:hypothetical protein